MNDDLKKICKECGELKPYSEYYKNQNTKTKCFGKCKKCTYKMQKKYTVSEKGKEVHKKSRQKRVMNGKNNYSSQRVSQFKKRSKEKGMSCDLTLELLEIWWKKTPDICYYCNTTIKEYIEIKNYIRDYSGKNELINHIKNLFNINLYNCNRMTYDRKNNQIGYTFDNIEKSCLICNRIKGSLISEKIMKVVAPVIISEIKKAISYE